MAAMAMVVFVDGVCQEMVVVVINCTTAVDVFGRRHHPIIGINGGSKYIITAAAIAAASINDVCYCRCQRLPLPLPYS